MPRRPQALIALALLGGMTGCSDYSYYEFEYVDVFRQTAAEQNDILMVIDNSASMGPYQEQLGQHFNDFLSWFITADVNYRLGVITTDAVSEGAGLIRGEVLTPETQAAGQVFADIVAVGTEGNGTEMGFEAMRMAIVDPDGVAANGEFLREEAYLSVVAVTDEFDSSPDSIPEYIAELQAMKGYTRDKVRIGALVALDVANCAGNQSRVGAEYVAATELTGGVAYDICDAEYGASLEVMSQNMSRLFDVFYLAEVPDTSSLEVIVNDEVVPCSSGAWTYETRTRDGDATGAIVFASDSLPELGSKMTVRYNAGSGDLAPFCQE